MRNALRASSTHILLPFFMESRRLIIEAQKIL